MRPSTSFDNLTKLVIPALSLAGTIAGIFKDQQRLAMILVGVGVASVAINFAPRLYEGALSRRHSRADDRLAQQVWPDLMMLVERFGKFIDNGRSDTIHGIILRNDPPWGIAIMNIARQNDFVPAAVLWGPWNQIAHSCRDFPADRVRLQESLSLFTWLIGTYQYHVVQVIFHRGAAALQEHLPASTRRDLTVAREAVVRFIADYKTFVDRTNRTLKTVTLSVPSLDSIPPI